MFRREYWLAALLAVVVGGAASKATAGDAVQAVWGRSEFSTASGSVFIWVGDGKWVEQRRNGPTSNFQETHRNGAYVEMYDADRKMYVRLYEDHGKWAPGDRSFWRRWPGSEGRWIR